MKKFSWYRKFKSKQEAIQMFNNIRKFLLEIYDIKLTFMYNKDMTVDGICEYETGKIIIFKSIYYFEGTFYTPAEMVSKIMHEVAHYVHYQKYPDDPCYVYQATKRFVRYDYKLEMWCDRYAEKYTKALFNIKPRGLRTTSHNKEALYNFLSLYEFGKLYKDLPEK